MTLKNMTIPLIQGGMGIGISLGNLAGSVAREGGIGVISTANTGYRKPDFWQNDDECNHIALEEEIQKARKIANGKGLIAINAMVASRDYTGMIKAAIKGGIDAIISGAGLPLILPEIAKGSKALLAPIVSSGKAAATICKVWQRKYEKLPDFVVIEGPLAGGHLGFAFDDLAAKTVKPLAELFTEVKNAVSQFGEIPIFVAGGILTADDVNNAMKMGADGVQVATPFIATAECDATDEYKKIMINAKDEDVTLIKSPVGMPGRAIRNPFVKKVYGNERVEPKRCINCLIPCNPKTTPYCITDALISAAEGDYENGLFFCSESIGKVNKMTTVKEVIDELLVVWREENK